MDKTMHDTTERIYLDHAATTPVDPRVVEAMLPYFTTTYGNPSSLHHFGQQARKALDEARATVAAILNCHPNDIVFTSCGSESDNLAIRGVALALRRIRGNHLITSTVEHEAVTRTMAQLEEEFGFEVTYLPVDHDGKVHPDDVAAALRPTTSLISVMYANNEVGTIEPIAEIARLAHERGVLVHTDAVQAGGCLDLDVDRLGVDLLSLSAHKFYGPKGVGLLYVRPGTPLLPTQTGGGHERHRRAGTENVPYIVGLATALKLAQENRPAENARLIALRDRLIGAVTQRIEAAYLTGHPTDRLPGHASFAFAGIAGEAILMHLDLAGIAVSTGSACTAGAAEPSHVLAAMGYPPEVARGSLRITLGRSTTERHLDYLLSVLPDVVARLRAISPAGVGGTAGPGDTREVAA